jgi:hypothetical protein
MATACHSVALSINCTLYLRTTPQDSEEPEVLRPQDTETPDRRNRDGRWTLRRDAADRGRPADRRHELLEAVRELPAPASHNDTRPGLADTRLKQTVHENAAGRERPPGNRDAVPAAGTA